MDTRSQVCNFFLLLPCHIFMSNCSKIDSCRGFSFCYRVKLHLMPVDIQKKSLEKDLSMNQEIEHNQKVIFKSKHKYENACHFGKHNLFNPTLVKLSGDILVCCLQCRTSFFPFKSLPDLKGKVNNVRTQINLPLHQNSTQSLLFYNNVNLMFT